MTRKQQTSSPISNERLRNTRAWANALVGQMSGADVIVAAIDELLERRAADDETPAKLLPGSEGIVEFGDDEDEGETI